MPPLTPPSSLIGWLMNEGEESVRFYWSREVQLRSLLKIQVILYVFMYGDEMNELGSHDVDLGQI